MRETRLFGSMSGNRKQSQAKPDCGNAGESRVMSHRKTNATAPVLDSTRLFAGGLDSERYGDFRQPLFLIRILQPSQLQRQWSPATDKRLPNVT